MRARRPGVCATCLASLLKLFNFLQAFVGVSLVVYSLLLLHRFHPDFLFDLPLPWFLCFLMGIGLTMCLIALVGYFAAEGYISCCLCSHAMLAILFIFLEAFVVGYLVLDRQWEKDLPVDVTGELGKLRAFIETNFEFCKWIGISVVVIQALSVLLAIVLQATISTRHLNFDSDDDIPIISQPLLNSPHIPVPVMTSLEGNGVHSDLWSNRMRQKYGLIPVEPWNHDPQALTDTDEDRKTCSMM